MCPCAPVCPVCVPAPPGVFLPVTHTGEPGQRSGRTQQDPRAQITKCSMSRTSQPSTADSPTTARPEHQTPAREHPGANLPTPRPTQREGAGCRVPVGLGVAVGFAVVLLFAGGPLNLPARLLEHRRSQAVGVMQTRAADRAALPRRCHEYYFVPFQKTSGSRDEGGNSPRDVTRVPIVCLPFVTRSSVRWTSTGIHDGWEAPRQLFATVRVAVRAQ